jgi:hypothetical protein
MRWRGGLAVLAVAVDFDRLVAQTLSSEQIIR